MRVIGVTGGIGSGKSTVSRILKDLGAFVIDADKISREIVHKGSEALKELAEYFGEGILDADGALDRRKLSAIVFEDCGKLQALNNITHKYISKRIIIDLETLKGKEVSDIVAIDVPIPVKDGFLDVADEVWVVIADKETRLKRIMERSGLTVEEASGRISSQMSDEEFIKLADEVIYNNGPIEELEKSVAKLFINTRTSR